MNAKIFELSIILIFTGLSIILIGLILAATRFKAKINGGGIIFIGPIPLIFGLNKGLKGVLILILFMLFLLVLSVQLLLTWS
ncbi:DUF131 domain-containing protein [Candidatus Bathyarchaeota archaeon]|nr:DUF131 domain-containing protein [Candidatus Bathyarchaeota archaeon]